jgi:hypothetical protein
MMHPRSIIRNAIAKALINRSEAYKGRVFIQRAAKLQSDHDMPCVCVYTTADRTDTSKQQPSGNFVQTLDIELHIYNRRAPDEIEPHQSVQGMPRQPANYALMAQDLDSICLDVELIVYEFIRKGNFEYNGDTVCVEQNTEISTRIDQSEDGQVPHALATLTFQVNYFMSLKQPLNLCPLTKILGDIENKSCGDGNKTSLKVTYP